MLAIEQGKRISPGTSLIILSALLITVLAFWKCNNYFFWRGDWMYLALTSGDFPGIAARNNPEDLKLLYKPLFWLQAKAFGVNAILYHYVNLLLVATAGFAFFHLCRRFFHNAWVALIPAAMLAIHPANFETTLWMVNQSEWLHLIVYVMFVLFLLKYFVSNKVIHLAFALVCMIISNLLFPNGAFAPLLALAGSLLFVESRRRRIRLAVFFAAIMLLIPVLIMLLIPAEHRSGAMASPLSRLDEVILSFFHFTGISITRTLIITERVLGTPSVIGCSLLYLAIIAWGLVRFPAIRKNLLFTLAWLVTSAMTIPLVREPEIISLRYYYTSLLIMPLILSLAIVIHAAWPQLVHNSSTRRWAVRIAYGVTVLLLTVYFFVDQRQVNIYEYRSVMNRERMELAITDGTAYEPFDDPIIEVKSMKLFFGRQQPIGETLKAVYLKLREETLFRLPTGRYVGRPD